MTRPYPYAIEVVAFSVIMLLAAAVIWVAFTVPEGGPKALATGIIMLVASPYFIVQGLRRKAVIKIDRIEGKLWLWLALCCFWSLLALFASSSLETVQTLTRLIYFVLAVFCLAMATSLRRRKEASPGDRNR